SGGTRAQPGHERRQLAVVQGRMVLHRRELCAGWKHALQVTAPTRRVVAAAIAAHGRPIENVLNASAHAIRGFRLFVPNRLDHPEHERGVDRSYRQLAYDGIGAGLERRHPLGGVLGVLPAGAVTRDIELSTSLELHATRSRLYRALPLFARSLDRVDILLEQ